MNCEKKVIYDDNYGCRFLPQVSFGKLTAEQRQNAVKVLNQFMAPMNAEGILRLIARLQIIAPERSKNEYDQKARTAIWIEELQRYPADIVNSALRRKYHWFPSLAEVLDFCDEEVTFRKLIEQGLRVSKTL